jgi:HdeA/HdeB family
MKLFSAGIFCLCLMAAASRAAEINIATLSCARYQNEMLAKPATSPSTDPINIVMWLFGYSVAKSGAHVMYGDALAGFGFSLDAECNSNPAKSLLDALAAVKPNSKNPMDLNALNCATFAARHIELTRSDAESADTIMMWLFGFAVASSGSHTYDSSSFGPFQTALMADCAKRPERSLFETLGAVKFPKPKG